MITKTTITTTKATKRVIEQEKVKNFYPPWRHVDEQTTPGTSADLKPMQPKDRLLGTEDHKDRFRSTKETVKTIEIKTLKLQPKL